MHRETQLRSLERKRMYTIFAPLDPDERLPREMLHERPTGGALFLGLVGRRYGPLGRWELAGMLWLPALATLLVVAGWTHMNGPIAFGVMALLLLGLVAFVLSGERESRLK
ncbi:MAG TPA: hypothetical protein VLR46_04245 [Candidatus Dormibacteraeota bacterium]|nr:hypothetical protein [Candidatus Dormibacteraeota bacterium]